MVKEQESNREEAKRLLKEKRVKSLRVLEKLGVI